MELELDLSRLELDFPGLELDIFGLDISKAGVDMPNMSITKEEGNKVSNKARDKPLPHNGKTDNFVHKLLGQHILSKRMFHTLLSNG